MELVYEVVCWAAATLGGAVVIGLGVLLIAGLTDKGLPTWLFVAILILMGLAFIATLSGCILSVMLEYQCPNCEKPISSYYCPTCGWGIRMLRPFACGKEVV